MCWPADVRVLGSVVSYAILVPCGADDPDVPFFFEAHRVRKDACWLELEVDCAALLSQINLLTVTGVVKVSEPLKRALRFLSSAPDILAVEWNRPCTVCPRRLCHMSGEV